MEAPLSVGYVSPMASLPPDQLLRQCMLFRTMDRKAQDDLAECLVFVPFEKGERVIEAGSPGHALYILLDGTLGVYLREGDMRLPVGLLEPGVMFGEIAFLAPDLPRTADVVGREPGVLAALTNVSYEELRQVNHGAATALEKAMLDVLAERMADTHRRMGELLERYRAGGFGSAMGWLRNVLGGA